MVPNLIGLVDGLTVPNQIRNNGFNEVFNKLKKEKGLKALVISVISILNLKPDDLGSNIDEVMMMRSSVETDGCRTVVMKLSFSHLPFYCPEL